MVTVDHSLASTDESGEIEKVTETDSKIKFTKDIFHAHQNVLP